MYVGEYASNDVEPFKTFDIVVGRQNAYDAVKTFLISEEETGMILDLKASHILVEPENITESTPRITLTNMLNLYQFMRSMIDSGKIIDNDTSFDIDDFKPFKCDVAGNDKNFGFNVVNDSSTELVVFEAAIDLMSYVDIFTDYESNKLALGMLADAPLETFLREHTQITSIRYLCLYSLWIERNHKTVRCIGNL